VVESFERDFLQRALRRHGGNITKAAERSACTARTSSRRCASSGSPPRRRTEMQLFARMGNLLRGLLAAGSADASTAPRSGLRGRHPGAREQYAKLRAAAAGILYMRSKLAKELERQSAELGRVRRQLDVAVDREDDVAALALIGRRDPLDAEVERLGAELGELTKEADGAKQNLITFQNEIARSATNGCA